MSKHPRRLFPAEWHGRRQVYRDLGMAIARIAEATKKRTGEAPPSQWLVGETVKANGARVWSTL